MAITLEELQVIIGAQTRGFQTEMTRIQNQVRLMTNGVNSQVGKISGAFRGLKRIIGATITVTGLTSVIKQAAKVEASISQIKRTMGESSNAYLKWAENTASSFGISQTAAMQYGSTFSNLVSSFAKSGKDVQQYTQQIMQSSAVIASSTGRTIEDTLERIRSGLLGNTEAVEDLGIYVNASTIKQSEAYRKLANGVPYEKLNYSIKQQIILMSVLEQSSTKFGNSIANNTQYQIMLFNAELSNLKLALGNAFLPVASVVLPLLTKFFSWMQRAIQITSRFFSVLFGKKKDSNKNNTESTSKTIGGATGVQNAYTNSLGDTAKQADKTGKALKKMSNSVAGFDEINQLNMGNSGDNGSGGGDSDGGSAPDANIPDFGGTSDSVGEELDGILGKVDEFVEKIRAKIKAVATFLQTHKVIILSIVGGLMAGIATLLVIHNWSAITGAIAEAFLCLGSILSSISAPILGVAILIGLIVGNIIYLWQTNEEFRDSVLEIWSQLCEFIATVWSDMWSTVMNVWDEYGQTLIDNLVGFMKAIQSNILILWEDIIKPIITNALEMLQWLWDKHLKSLVETIVDFVIRVANAALELYNKFFAPIINILVKVFKPIVVSVFNFLVNSIGTAIGVISDELKGLIRILGGVIDFVVGVFTINWGKAWQGVSDIFGGMCDGLVGLIKWPLNIVIDLINTAIEGLNSLLTFKMPDFLGGGEIGVSIPKIPKLAKGGIVNSATLAVVGEAGREAVVPLENNTGGLDLLANKLLERMPLNINNDKGYSSNSGNGDLTVQLVISDTKLGEVMVRSFRKLERRTGKVIFNL